MNVYHFFRLNAFIRKLAIVIFILTFTEKANAQKGVDTLFRRFGFQAGINISNMDFNSGEPPPAIPSEAAWKTGFTFGFQLHVPIVKKLLLQPEYSFSQRNGSDKSLGIDYTIHYFSLPVLFNYQFSPRFSLIAGPQFEITTDAKSYENGEETTITHDVEERGIGIIGGIEVTIFQSLFISARYLQGLNHVGIGQRSNVKEFKFQVVYLTAGIRF